MKALIEKTPVPYIGYMLILAGFALLGMFTLALANEHALAPVAGVGTVLAFGGSIGCVYLRRYQISRALREDGPQLSIDLMTPPRNDEEVDRYLQTYRAPSANPAT